LARVAEPLILIDWSDLKADQSVRLLRASLAVGGRSRTLRKLSRVDARNDSQLLVYDQLMIATFSFGV
jgi:hypothetical protein